MKYSLRQRLVRDGSAAVQSRPHVRKEGCRDHNAGRGIPPLLALITGLQYTEKITKAEGVDFSEEAGFLGFGLDSEIQFGKSMREVGLQLTAPALTATTCEVRPSNRGLTPVSISALANWPPTSKRLMVLLELSGAYRTKTAFLG
jgi:hypothetical protein